MDRNSLQTRRVFTALLTATAGVVLAGLIAWLVLPATTSFQDILFLSATELPPPPATSSVSFAEECAYRISWEIDGSDARICRAEQCDNFGVESESTHTSCDRFCQRYLAIRGSKFRLESRSCEIWISRLVLGNVVEDEVIGGTVDNNNQFMSTISISGLTNTSTGEQTVCSGVLISPRLALTASHCLKNRSLTAATVGNLNDLKSSNSNPARITGYEVFSKTAVRLTATGKVTEPVDLAIISLSRAFDEAHVARLAKPKSGRRLGILKVVGFGWNEKQEFGKRRYANVFVSTFDCPKSVSSEYDCAWGHELVAGRKPQGTETELLDPDTLASIKAKNPDACGADSGGPAYEYTGDDIWNLKAGDRFPRYRDEIVKETSRAVLGIVGSALSAAKHPAYTDGAGKQLNCGAGGRYVNISLPENRAWILKTAKCKFGVELEGFSELNLTCPGTGRTR